MNEGSVTVDIRTTDDRVVLTVADDGEGLPESFSLRSDGTLGLQIVQTLVKDDLKGTFHLMRAGERGAKGIVSFPRIELGSGLAVSPSVPTPVGVGPGH
jgi:two-component sensor histidine kinase